MSKGTVEKVNLPEPEMKASYHMIGDDAGQQQQQIPETPLLPLVDSKIEIAGASSGAPCCEPANCEKLCYAPLETLEELLSYQDVRPECTLIQETVPLATIFSDVKIQVNGRRFRTTGCPKTLICHDYRGGYLDDRFIQGTNNPINYTFRHWLQTDIFCYFSHKFVTIPPIGWINAAHSHGVQTIGTIITESEDGKLLCQKLLDSQETMEKAVQKLCLIAKHYQFDGWLVNIENTTDKPEQLVEFLHLLTLAMKEVVSDSVVLWYDSVTIHGELEWQDELNYLNKPYFDVCDGIYLNYGWNDEKLHRSVEEAEDREFDVFVGVDVFGRGCFGGGGLDTFKAVEKIASQRLSVAIFAPGWTFECHPYENFPLVDDQLWNKCAKYFYFRTLMNPNAIENENEMCGNPLHMNLNMSDRLSDIIQVQNDLVEPEPEQQPPTYDILICTDFNPGFGQEQFIFGTKHVGDFSGENGESGPWYNLNNQSYQPIINCFRPTEVNPQGFQGFFDTSKGFLGGGSLKISSQNLNSGLEIYQTEPACPVWIPLSIPLKDIVNGRTDRRNCALIAVVAWQSWDQIPGHAADDILESENMNRNSASESNPIKIFLEFMKPSISTRKVIRLSNLGEQIAFERPQYPITVQLKHYLPPAYANRPEVENLSFSFIEAPSMNHELNGWNISCFLMDVNHCLDWNMTGFRVGTLHNINLGLVSLALVTY